MTSRISLGQLDGAILTYKDGNGENVKVHFDGTGCDNLNKSKDEEDEHKIKCDFDSSSF